MPETFLLADIGGTHARFALLKHGQLDGFADLAVADFPDPVAAIRAYLAGAGSGRNPTSAILAAAGPVHRGHVAETNAPWIIDANDLQRALGLASVQVINDSTALALSLPALTPSGLHSLGGGSPLADAPRLVVGPGTGLGVGALIAGPPAETVVASEGGHATLAAENEREAKIIQLLRKDLSHVSAEVVLSGQGIVRLYRTVSSIDGIAAPDRNTPDIVAHALAGDCPASVAALGLFCDFLGSFAGDLALIFGARGGVYIGGGIVPRFVGLLERSRFRARFETKGRLKPYLAAMPIWVILEPQPAFLGLRRLAER